MFTDSDDEEDYRIPKKEHLSQLSDQYTKLLDELQRKTKLFENLDFSFQEFNGIMARIFTDIKQKYVPEDKKAEMTQISEGYCENAEIIHNIFEKFIFSNQNTEEIEEIIKTLNFFVTFSKIRNEISPDFLLSHPNAKLIQQRIIEQEQHAFDTFLETSEFPPQVFMFPTFVSVLVDFSRVYSMEVSLLHSLADVFCNVDNQDLILKFPDPCILSEFDLFQRLIDLFGKLNDYYKKFYKKFMIQASPLTDAIDEIKYFIEEIVSVFLNELPSVFNEIKEKRRELTNIERDISKYRQLSTLNTNDRVVEAFKFDIGDGKPENILSKIEAEGRELFANVEILRKRSKDLDILISKMQNKENKKYQEKCKMYDDAMNAIQYYNNIISASLSNFHSAITHIPFLTNTLLTEDAPKIIAVDIPTMQLKINRVKEIKSAIEEKQAEIDHINKKIHNCREHTTVLERIKEFHSVPKECPNCVINPEFCLPCGHVFCASCIAANSEDDSVYCPFCDTSFDLAVKINWY